MSATKISRGKHFTGQTIHRNNFGGKKNFRVINIPSFNFYPKNCGCIIVIISYFAGSDWVFFVSSRNKEEKSNKSCRSCLKKAKIRSSPIKQHSHKPQFLPTDSSPSLPVWPSPNMANQAAAKNLQPVFG